MTAPALPTLSPEALRAWLAATADATLTVDSAGRIIEANPPAERLFGYDAGALCGLSVDVLVPEPMRPGYRQRRDAYLAAPAPTVLPLRGRLVGLRRDGTQFPIGVSLTPVALGQRMIVITVIRDVSDTRRAGRLLEHMRRDEYVMQIGHLALESPDYEQAIQRIPELAAHALGVPSVVVFSTDWRHDTPFIRASTGLTPATAQTLKTAFGQMRFIRNVFASERLEAITTRHLKDPRFAAIRKGLADAGLASFAMVPLFGNDEPLGAIAALAVAHMHFGDDEVAFLHSIANLLAASVQRSRSEEELAHAHRLEAIGQLTGGIAHDFNNLLTVISGNLQLLGTDLDGRPEAQESIAGALRAVERGSSLTHRLLAFARRQPLQPRRVAPEPLLAELAQMLRRTLGEAISITVDCGSGLPDLYADPNELNTALVNLALNARDAMPRGGILTISAHGVGFTSAANAWKLHPGYYVAFEVADTGIGMTPETRARVFEPFFTTKEAGKGSGLGLPMVYGFAMQSGGAVALESKLGYGTTVSLLLPIASASVPAAAPLPAAADTRAARHATILVVEDETDVRALAARFLQGFGYSVLSASTADQALEFLGARPDIDLLFSDVMLGRGMNGIELAHAARQRLPRLAVLLTSGYEGHDGDVASQTLAGAPFEFLPKPYRREQLAAGIQRLLDQAAS